MERICAAGPLIVHFVDVAHPSSVRTIPYLRAWAERYGELGLSVIGVNSPRFPFTADPAKLAAALERLEVGFPFAADSAYDAWHAYGCEGWPSLFLWSKGGALRWYHFGEGEYGATEDAIRDQLAPPPRPACRSRWSPAGNRRPGAIVAVPSEEDLSGRLDLRAVGGTARRAAAGAELRGG